MDEKILGHGLVFGSSELSGDALVGDNKKHHAMIMSDILEAAHITFCVKLPDVEEPKYCRNHPCRVLAQEALRQEEQKRVKQQLKRA
jgi:hypothetical protein